MQSRVRTLIVALLFLCGAGIGFFVYPRLMGSTDAEWEQQMRADAITLIDMVHPGMRLPQVVEPNDAFWEAWDKRRANYDHDQLEVVRSKLLLYLQFVEVEWEEALTIWSTGDHTVLSDEARRLHRELIEAFGPYGEDVVALFAEKLREDAYQASPVVAGYDENRPYDKWHVVVTEWLPTARERAKELTRPLD